MLEFESAIFSLAAENLFSKAAESFIETAQ